MARESRSASSSAAAALGNGHMRQPPAAGPRAVECTAMMHLRPVFSSKNAWTPSWPSKAGESNKVMPRTSLKLGWGMARRFTPDGPPEQPRSRAGRRLQLAGRGGRGGDLRRPRRQGLRRVADEGQDVPPDRRALLVAHHQVPALGVVGRAVGGLQLSRGLEGGVLGDDLVVRPIEV